MSQSQENFQTEGQKDGKNGRMKKQMEEQTLIDRTLLATARGPKKISRMKGNIANLY